MDNWLQISTSSGSGDTSIYVSASNNPESTRRITNLTISTRSLDVTVPVLQKVDERNEYLTMIITKSGLVTWHKRPVAGEILPYVAIEYRKNGGNWQSLIATSGGTPIIVSTGDVLEFRGDYPYYGYNDGTYFGAYNFANYDWDQYQTTAEFVLAGNIMSLISSTNFQNLDTLSGDISHKVFPSFFRGCTGLTDASNLYLPARTVDWEAYEFMFANCTNLKTPPALPASSVGSLGYYGMFENCTSLLSAPTLPATHVGMRGYAYMFENCTSLVTAPDLPAMSIGVECYIGMFSGCTNLENIPTRLPATALTQECYMQMFSNCVKIQRAPDLPALTLAENSYFRMFDKCRSLNYIRCLATDIDYESPTLCGTFHWVENVATTGTFIKNAAMTDWPSGVNGIPVGWTVQNEPSTVFSVSPTSLSFDASSNTVTSQTITVTSSNPYRFSVVDDSGVGIQLKPSGGNWQPASNVSGPSGTTTYNVRSSANSYYVFPLHSQLVMTDTTDSSITAHVDITKATRNTVPVKIKYKSTNGQIIVPASGAFYAKSGNNLAHVVSNTYQNGWGEWELDVCTVDVWTSAFTSSSTISEIVLEAPVERVNGYAFTQCPNLTAVTLNNVTFVGAAFGESGVKQVSMSNTSVPGSLTKNAFNGCSALTSVTLTGNIEIGAYAFMDCDIRSLYIPSGVTFTENSTNVFARNHNLSSVTLQSGGSNKIIPTYAFMGTPLTDVTIPQGYTGVSAYAFGSCSQLTAITLSSTVRSVGSYGGYDFRPLCSNSPLRIINCYATTAPNIGTTSSRNPGVWYFYGTGADNGVLHYPSGSNYSTWMANETGCLGTYNWTSVGDL